MSYEAAAVIFDLLSELDTAFPNSPHRLVDIVAIKRNIRSARNMVITIGRVQPMSASGVAKINQSRRRSIDTLLVTLIILRPSLGRLSLERHIYFIFLPGLLPNDRLYIVRPCLESLTPEASKNCLIPHRYLVP